MSKSFRKTVEDFKCENCGSLVYGKGFTDHCPSCLFSKHVDITPGDRAASCGGKMKPISIAPKDQGYVIEYICEKCGYTYSNKSAEYDDVSSFIEMLNSNISDRLPPA